MALEPPPELQARVEQIHSPIQNRRRFGPEDRVIPHTKPRGRTARAAIAAAHARQDARCLAGLNRLVFRCRVKFAGLGQ